MISVERGEGRIATGVEAGATGVGAGEDGWGDDMVFWRCCVVWMSGTFVEFWFNLRRIYESLKLRNVNGGDSWVGEQGGEGCDHLWTSFVSFELKHRLRSYHSSLQRHWLSSATSCLIIVKFFELCYICHTCYCKKCNN